MSLAENLQRIQNQISDACARAHRDPAAVQLMAVSKTHPADAILEAQAAGLRLFGENRVQEFAAKSAELPSTLDPRPAFHLIGPLQSNKTTRAAELFDAIDSLDSFKIAQRLNSAAAALNKTLPVLLEVKLSPEESKHGLAPAELPALLEQLAPLANLQPRGLRTVPPYSDDPEQARPYFARLRELRDQNRSAHPTLTELSMGMSHDFAVAIEEGATTIRVGTALFGARPAV
jgi:pyridoxal phosphate enzyme (YggS family)